MSEAHEFKFTEDDSGSPRTVGDFKYAIIIIVTVMIADDDRACEAYTHYAQT